MLLLLRAGDACKPHDAVVVEVQASWWLSNTLGHVCRRCHS